VNEPARTLFEMPKLFGLDGRQITEDRRLCLAGCNVCLAGGTVPPEPEAGEVV
jgi:hypothetical protein